MPDRYGKYSYFDSADDQDIEKKLWYVTKLMTKLGIAVGAVDALTVTAPNSRLGVLGCFARSIGGFVSLGMTYSVSAYISADLRKQNDEWNHATGAIATGCVAGAMLSNPWVPLITAVIGAPIAANIKHAYMLGYKPLNATPESYQFPYFKADYTMQELPYVNSWRKDRLVDRYDKANDEFRRSKDTLPPGQTTEV